MADVIISEVVKKLADIASNLIAKESSRLSKLKENILWIEEEMKCIQFFLKKADAVESESRGLADDIKSIWDLAYDLEDIMEEYFPKLSPLRRSDCKGRLGWLLKAKTVRDFAVKIEEIKQRVVDINRRRQTYQVQDANGPAGREVWDPRKTLPHIDEVNVVGMDEHVEELVAKVTDQDLDHRAISITGMAGIGKTTLARKLYNSVRQNFTCSAWICVSRKQDLHKLLHDIARQVGLTEECKHNLVVNLSHFLSQKRYVIVIDDLWQIEHWDALKNGIPVNSMNGSRIIITSRSKDICLQIAGKIFLHELQPLDEEKSRELFFKILMAAPQDNDKDGHPSQLKDVGEKILKRCGGVPLAIAAIGGLLLSRESSIHAWEGILGSIGKDEDQYSKIFALSYEDLPLMLKPCFLYFGLFPEDHRISAFQLINLWAAEGFIHDSGVRTAEDMGQDYLNHLVGRNLVQVIERRCNGTIRLCRIHDIFHDLCISKAREINFFNILNHATASANRLAPRRVTTAFQSAASNFVSSNHQNPKLRALLCFNDFTIGYGKPHVELRLRNFKSLRMLILTCHSGLRAPMNEIVKLKYLYHLRMEGEYVIDLPYAISNLKNLIILELLCREVILPEVIWKMKQLRHIRLPHLCRAPSVYGFHLNSHRFHPFEVSLPNLQTLYGLPAKLFVANWLHKLDSLRRLKVYCTTQRIIEVLSAVTPLSQRLEELHLLEDIDINSTTKFRSILDLSKYARLGKLFVELGNMIDFPRHDKLPTCLTELILESTLLKMDPMVNLKKLPRLKILILGGMSYCGKKMVCSGEADSFPQLKVLKIDAMFLEMFVVEEGAMPKLKDLTLTRCIPSMRLPDRIRNIIMIVSYITWSRYEI